MTKPQVSTERESLATTELGKLRGRVRGGAHCFLGVPYGESTSGAQRFLPPVPVRAWTGVRDAVRYGPDAPQLSRRTPDAATQNNLEREPSEDCLVLNVFTPSVASGGTSPAARRPVMVWCHGGGFVTGSGSGALYDGERLALRGDVVVVTLNHRLGALGFLPLAELDPQAQGAVNVGMLDIVLALRWVRDHISVFGGDPSNVTVFGESGGGRKVSSLLAMPMAHGLFHRAVIQSGPAVFMNDADAVRALVHGFLDELGIRGAPLRALQELPLATLLRAQASVLRRLGQSAEGLAQTFAPVVDGEVLPQHPFDPEAPAVSDDIPIIVGYNRTEATLFMGRDPDLLELDEAGLRRRIGAWLPQGAERVIEIYRKANPDASCADLLAYIATGLRRYPIDSIRLAERKARRGRAPAYLYTLTWQTPAARGALRTPHALEIPFVFDNVEAAGRFVGPGDEPVQMAERMSSIWLTFARSGDPNARSAGRHEAVPEWPAYDPVERAQMLFDLPCRVERDFGAVEREAWDPLFYPDSSGSL